MNILIVDDEAPARDRLRQLLEEGGTHTVVGEAGNESLNRPVFAGEYRAHVFCLRFSIAKKKRRKKRRFSEFHSVNRSSS